MLFWYIGGFGEELICFRFCCYFCVLILVVGWNWIFDYGWRWCLFCYLVWGMWFYVCGFEYLGLLLVLIGECV